MKNLIRVTIIIIGALLLHSCSNNSQEKKIKHLSILEKIENSTLNIVDATKSLKKIATLDHHRMAEEAGVYTPPAIAVIVSDHSINSKLIVENQLIGLDLPFKFLSYSEPDTTKVSVAYTSSEFIQKRHNINDELLADYSNKLNEILKNIPQEIISTSNIDDVNKGFGLVKIKSDYDFETTVKNIKAIVMSQGDTKWFANIDYQKDAIENNITVRPTTLLLFGGPAPGGKAMSTSPKIGLDAFCQKLLVFENDKNEIWIAYNDIVAFANLYYKTSTKPQQIINQRLKMTFTKAVKIESVEQ
jgi:uncharacterized protein (DUF302 family)